METKIRLKCWPQTQNTNQFIFCKTQTLHTLVLNSIVSYWTQLAAAKKLFFLWWFRLPTAAAQPFQGKRYRTPVQLEGSLCGGRNAHESQRSQDGNGSVLEPRLLGSGLRLHNSATSSVEVAQTQPGKHEETHRQLQLNVWTALCEYMNNSFSGNEPKYELKEKWHKLCILPNPLKRLFVREILSLICH